MNHVCMKLFGKHSVICFFSRISAVCIDITNKYLLSAYIFKRSMCLFIHYFNEEREQIELCPLHTIGEGMCLAVDLYWGVSVIVLGERGVIMSIADNSGHTIV